MARKFRAKFGEVKKRTGRDLRHKLGHDARERWARPDREHLQTNAQKESEARFVILERSDQELPGMSMDTAGRRHRCAYRIVYRGADGRTTRRKYGVQASRHRGLDSTRGRR